MLHLHTIRLPAIPPEAANSFPFRVPAIASMVGGELELTADVTFFIGENGSGKSTLLEAIACAAESVAVGSDHLGQDRSLDGVRRLADCLKLSWRKRTRRGFFLRAEDFFGYARRMQELKAEAEAEIRAIHEDSERSALARSLASMPHSRTIHDLRRSYGDGLDSVSHGESFFTLFKSRFVPDGLYLLDEPEAPLSPMRQIGLLSLIKMAVEEKGGQFIIATHSPIVMAYPGAAIYSFDGGHIRPVTYDEAEHVSLTRDFLNHPQRYLKHL
ncbi:MAG: AAA family ATPase [Chloroflexaceae bacterium]|jgi:predicted ATPase|nr:AAA family ATPase [Chloroflexaceae bacterium]